MARTPGPWRVSDKVYFDGRDDYLVVTSAARWVCSVMVNDQAEEDARLIAAAPELLEALSALLSQTLSNQAPAGQLAVAKARAAIARAEGRT
jgi:hypothetical protein